MSISDLRFVILVAINIVKSHAWEWDPFEVINDLTWTKLCILTSLLFLFTFISIQISINNSPNINIGSLKLQVIKSFSPSLLTCFLVCLFLPQSLFWYLYPVILVWFWCFACVSKALSSFVSWVRTVLSVVPDLNISIEAANAGDDHDQLHERGEEAANVEEGTPQV